MPYCESCDAFVSDAFARVLGDNDDNVQGCQECVGRTPVREGGAVDDAGGRA